ncbi:MAG: hypothetical protein RLT87_10175, partial [Gammaproteobacteria bacterium]
MKDFYRQFYLFISLLAFFVMPLGSAYAGVTCPSSTPIKCADGSCKMTQAECAANTSTITSNNNEPSSITVPYSIEGLSQDDVIEGKLKGNVTFPLKKGENKQTVTIKLKKNAMKSGDKDPQFSLGELSDKKVKAGKNKSVVFKLPDQKVKPKAAPVNAPVIVNSPIAEEDKTVTIGEAVDINLTDLFTEEDGINSPNVSRVEMQGHPKSLRLDDSGFYNERHYIRGTPKDSDIGEHEITLIGRDTQNNKDNDATYKFTLTV